MYAGIEYRAARASSGDDDEAEEEDDEPALEATPNKLAEGEHDDAAAAWLVLRLCVRLHLR